MAGNLKSGFILPDCVKGVIKHEHADIQEKVTAFSLVKVILFKRNISK